MGYRSIFISNPCRLSVKNDQLIVFTDAEHSIPVEDIRTVVVENCASTISAYALSRLSECGVCVFFCDKTHMPSAILQPFGQYVRRKNQLELQMTQAKPKLKRLWQTIIVSKIQNQAKALELCEKKEKDVVTLLGIAENVRSGDPDNLESQAAAHYFRVLFGSTFARSHDNIFNAGLNYGYSIIRGFICRVIADYGFEPSIGIHHASHVNPFNLADDFIEPFRPIVDLYVYCSMDPDQTELSTQDKAGLCSILNLEVISGKERHSLAYAIERMIHSIERYYESDDASPNILLPSFSELKMHEYE